MYKCLFMNYSKYEYLFMNYFKYFHNLKIILLMLKKIRYKIINFLT